MSRATAMLCFEEWVDLCLLGVGCVNIAKVSASKFFWLSKVDTGFANTPNLAYFTPKLFR